MKNITLILGVIRFYEEDDTTDKCAVIEKITGFIKFESYSVAEHIGESLLKTGEHDSYIVIEKYDGQIRYETDFNTEIERLIK